MLRRSLLLAVLVATVWAPAVRAAPKSGPQRGEFMPAFDVVDVTGPTKDRVLTCYTCYYDTLPVLAVFLNGKVADAAPLLRAIDRLARANRELNVFVVFLAGPEKRRDIEKLARDQHLRVPLAHLLQGEMEKTKALLRLSPTASNTLVLFRDKVAYFNAVDIRPDSMKPVEKAAREMLRK